VEWWRPYLISQPSETQTHNSMLRTKTAKYNKSRPFCTRTIPRVEFFYISNFRDERFAPQKKRTPHHHDAPNLSLDHTVRCFPPLKKRTRPPATARRAERAQEKNSVICSAKVCDCAQTENSRATGSASPPPPPGAGRGLFRSMYTAIEIWVVQHYNITITRVRTVIAVAAEQRPVHHLDVQASVNRRRRLSQS
jgi:hypothetical protein